MLQMKCYSDPGPLDYVAIQCLTKCVRNLSIWLLLSDVFLGPEKPGHLKCTSVIGGFLPCDKCLSSSFSLLLILHFFFTFVSK